MAKTTGRLFFSIAKKMAKLQRQALKIATSGVAATASSSKQRGKKRQSPKSSTRSSPSTASAAGAYATFLGKPPASVPLKSSSSAAAKKAAKKGRVPGIPVGQGRWQALQHRSSLARSGVTGRLDYFLYRPGQGSVAGKPLLVMLHGCQQTAFDLAQGSRMNRFADCKDFVVLYPEQSGGAQPMRCWRWYQPDALHGLAEAGLIADLTAAVVDHHRLDPTRIYIAGLSAGAGMAGLTALRRPDLFAAVAMHSGAVMGEAHNSGTGLRTMRRGTLHDPVALADRLWAKAPSAPMPAVILHGERDHVVSSRNAMQLMEQFVYLNRKSYAAMNAESMLAEGSASPASTAHSPKIKAAVLAESTHRQYQRLDAWLDGKPQVRLCLLRHVGHAWSGGDGRLKFNSAEGPSACSLIWQFFRLHQRN